MLEKARANKDQLAAALEGEESELAAAAKVLDESRSELARLDVAGEEEGRSRPRRAAARRGPRGGRAREGGMGGCSEGVDFARG